MHDAENNEDQNIDAQEALLLNSIEDVKQQLKVIQTQLLLSEAVHHGGSIPQQQPVKNYSDLEEGISELTDIIDRLCIQESALQSSLECNTLKNILSSGVPSSDLGKLLEHHVYKEGEKISLSLQLREEHTNLQVVLQELIQTVRKYTTYEEQQKCRSEENEVPEDDNESARRMKKQLKEIRFMQLLIPRIISEFKLDINEEVGLKGICAEARDAVSSIDDLL